MKPSLSLKFLEGVTEKLREENDDLRKQVESLRDVVGSLQSEVQALQMVVSENIERREAVETGLVSVEQACTNIQETQSKLSSAVELQAQYSRKSTLLLSGRAIPAFREGEHTRSTVLTLLKEFLGMDVHPRAITACHRLRNKSVILVRFADMDERMAVYRQRTSPKKQGLLVHESLTNERLAVIKILQKLHKPKESSPFQSYYTSSGRIFIRLTNSPKALELFVGTTEKDILDICKRSKGKDHSSSSKVLPPGASSLRQADASDRSDPSQQDPTNAPTGGKNGCQSSVKHPNTVQGIASETPKVRNDKPGASGGCVAEGGTTKVSPSGPKVSDDQSTNPDPRNPAAVEHPAPSASCEVHDHSHTVNPQTSANPEVEVTPKTSPVTQTDSAPIGNLG